MKLDFAHIRETTRHRALASVRVLATAFVVGFSALAAAA